MYTVGTLFHHNRRIPHSHAIWHLFVLGGSACHFMAVLNQFTLPARIMGDGGGFALAG